ncbi:dephospho-CoA kinase [Litchfieldia salsa]|uniref:Dephospho-CoA kinase n=1 Tax=Litchfieldia salsa TaxID=930152 RepID=A0A1H0P1X6_9BACI|nr:dephospho-CoA kinase [Litchfieldia salsa]SDO98705.1 dephospho-CoA kinase [Litchfieldia salsa]
MTLVIGLTGGIASGKSTVSRMLLEMGLPVIDADVIAKRIVEIGQHSYELIIQTFGEEVLNDDLSINRAKLGSIIFNDDVQRQKLNAIVHPAVRKNMLEEQKKLVEQGNETIVLDIPLLFESDLTHLVDKTIVVYVDDEVQVERLMKRNHFTLVEATSRISSQMPLKKKVALADEVINNNGTMEETKKQLLKILTNWNVIYSK